MRAARTVLTVLMALPLAAGWAFLYWQSSGVELTAANLARSALNEARAIDARWNDPLVGGGCSAQARRRRSSRRAMRAPWLPSKCRRCA